MTRKHHALTILQFFRPPFFNKIAIFGVNTLSMVLQPTVTNFCPIATAAWLRLLNQSREAKRMVKNSQEFSIFRFCNYHCF
jgi:hypothetical protein